MDIMKDALKKAGYSEPDNRNKKAEAKHSASKGFDAFEKLHEDYTDRAERVIIELQNKLGKNYKDFTTSKIRNILAMVSDIYNDVLTEQDEVLNDEIRGKIAYLKVRLIYECGREPNIVKPFVELAGLLDIISGIGSSRQRFIDFEHYMEALVAYHRFHEGKD